jgi:hypothetical protein
VPLVTAAGIVLHALRALAMSLETVAEAMVQLPLPYPCGPTDSQWHGWSRDTRVSRGARDMPGQAGCWPRPSS